MKRIDWKYLVLIFSTAIVLDLISTHIFATALSEEGFSILEIASKENNFILSNFWVWTNSIVMGEILDFAVKFSVAVILLRFLIGQDWIKPKYHSLIFFFTLATSFWFIFFGAVYNTFYLITGDQISATVQFIGFITYFLIGIIGISVHTYDWWKNKSKPTLVLTD